MRDDRATMKRKRHDFALGLSAILFAALFIITFFFLNPFGQADTRRIVVRFRHSDGMAPIKPGSPVLLSGALDIGRVAEVHAENVSLPLPDGGEATELMLIVQADVNRDIELFGDTRITTDQPAVGGAGFLVILDVGTPGIPLESGKPIDGLPPQSFAATISGLSRRLLDPNGFVDKLDQMIDPNAEDSIVKHVLSVLADVNAITTELKAQTSSSEQKSLMSKVHLVLDDLTQISLSMRGQLSSADSANALAKIHVILDRLAEGLSEVNGMLAENRAPIASAVAGVQRIVRQTDEQLIAALIGELDADNPESLLGKIHVSMKRLNDSLGNIRMMSATGRDMLAHNRPALERTIANAREMSGQLNEASKELRAAPWRLLYRPDKNQTREMTIFEAARTFAEAATYLDDAAARLEAAQVAAARSPGGAEADKEIEAIRASVRKAFERFQVAEEFLWKNMK